MRVGDPVESVHPHPSRRAVSEEAVYSLSEEVAFGPALTLGTLARGPVLGRREVEWLAGRRVRHGGGSEGVGSVRDVYPPRQPRHVAREATAPAGGGHRQPGGGLRAARAQNLPGVRKPTARPGVVRDLSPTPPLSHVTEAPRGRYLAALSFAALGVVYGDIGTSPLYAIRESFGELYGVAPTEENILGVLSLIFWSLIVVISVKYLVFVMRADNHGEGGILALTALVTPTRHAAPGGEHRLQKDRSPAALRRLNGLVFLGLFGAALLYGDGMITPAISVLSAIEGLEVGDARVHALRDPDHRRHPGGPVLDPEPGDGRDR